MKTSFIINGISYSKSGDSIEKGGNGSVIFISSDRTDESYAVKFFNYAGSAFFHFLVHNLSLPFAELPHAYLHTAVFRNCTN